MMTWLWNPADTPEELHGMLRLLAADYPLAEGGEATLRFHKAEGGGVAVSRSGSGWEVVYSARREAARGLGLALAGVEGREEARFDSIGIMLDCSRNAVIRVDAFQRWLRCLTLLGYDHAMLYTENVYLVPGEPSFGYLRGAYTPEELRAIDDYAAALGIEMIPCIQTLGHMEQLIRFQGEWRGTESTLRVGDENVLAMLDRVIAFWRTVFRSGKIHIGMDESWRETGPQFADFLRQHKFELFAEHLKRVNELCHKHGYANPLIWADMYFAIAGGKHHYYDPDVTFPEFVLDAFPPNVRPVYWDYYNTTPEFFRRMIRKHRELSPNLWMGSGVRTSRSFWYDHEATRRSLLPCVEACIAENVREIFFTMWRDDGAYCDLDSALAGLVFAAGAAWNGKDDPAKNAALFRAVSGSDYRAVTELAAFQCRFEGVEGVAPHLLWDDPLQGISERTLESQLPGFCERAEAQYQQVREDLAPYRADCAAGDFDYAWLLADLLAKKLAFRRDLLAAYRAGTPEIMIDRAEHEMPEALSAFAVAFRRQWRRCAKPDGLEVIQGRFAAMAERYRECARLIREFNAGDRTALAALEETRVVGSSFWHRSCSTAGAL